MHCFRHHSKYIIILLFPAISWLFINFAINGHYHKLSNGEIIYHCHPYKHDKNKNSPFENHHHTESECLVIAQISNPLVSLFVYLILIGQFLLLCKEIIIIENLYILLRSYLYINNYRSPPIIHF